MFHLFHGTFQVSLERPVPRCSRVSQLVSNPVPGRPGIALVSFSQLATLCETVAPRYADQARFFSVRAGYGAAVAALQTHIDGGTVDVVLAAGSNGAYLRDNLSVPVVMVKVNGFDVLNAIAQAISLWPGESVGLVLHEAISKELAALGKYLRLDLRQRAYRSLDEVREAVDTLAAEGCTVIIGPGMACDLALRAGLHSVFLYSLGAVEEAFERSIELGRMSRQKESKRVRLNTIVAHLRDGVAAFDESGQVEVVNPAMLELLGLDRAQDVSGQLIRTLAPHVRDASVRDAGDSDSDTPASERIEQVGGRALIMNSLPIVEHGVRAGIVVTAQDALVAQRIDRSLRTSQRPRHLVARHKLADLTGTSAAIARVRRLAQASAAHDATLLLIGESGTGKELVAQGVHNASARRGNPFVAFNCAALPEGLIESELFGHEEGAFTGARRGGKPGLFEVAHTGTIFLDEVGEMPAALQSRLLRVLQEREVMKLGAGRATPIDVRVIAATHRDLRELVRQGTFRADLYFRLNLLQIALPALRERREDIPGLARELLVRSRSKYGLPAPSDGKNDARIVAFLQPLFASYAWPGNVRELENLVARAAIYLTDDAWSAQHDLREIFPEMFAEAGDAAVAGEVRSVTPDGEVRSVTPDDVRRALAAHGGNRAAASRALGIGRTTLWRLLKALPNP